MKIRCKHLVTIPNERLQRWRNVLVVARPFELVNGKRNGEKENGVCRNGQGLRFPNACDLCHVQVNCSAPVDNNNK